MERLCFAEAWPERALEDVLANPAVGAWVLEGPEARALAYLMFREAASEAEILRIGALPAHRRQGHALRVLRVFLAWCGQRGIRQVFLEVREDNQPARRLYERLKFELTSRREGYYTRPPGNALVYRWSG